MGKSRISKLLPIKVDTEAAAAVTLHRQVLSPHVTLRHQLVLRDDPANIRQVYRLRLLVFLRLAARHFTDCARENGIIISL